MIAGAREILSQIIKANRAVINKSTDVSEIYGILDYYSIPSMLEIDITLSLACLLLFMRGNDFYVRVERLTDVINIYISDTSENLVLLSQIDREVEEEYSKEELKVFASRVINGDDLVPNQNIINKIKITKDLN